MKPIILDAEMVRAIQDGRKTVTRLVVEPQPNVDHKFFECTDSNPIIAVEGTADAVNRYDPPYQPGDILYVLEPWWALCSWVKGVANTKYGYAVKFIDGEEVEFYFDNSVEASKWEKYLDELQWQSPDLMPQGAARAYLRVTDVRVERLQDITEEQVIAEGIREWYCGMGESGWALCWKSSRFFSDPICAYIILLWNPSHKQEEHTIYGWDANPWVWVIQFERISKEEALHGR